MSDSESKDTDKGIRYITEYVRNKTKDSSRKSTKKSNYEQSRIKKYSRSPSPIQKDFKSSRKNKKRRKNKSCRSNPSSSDDESKNKSSKKEFKQDKNNSAKIDSNLTNREHLVQEKIIGPTLPSHLLNKSKEKRDCHETKNNENVSVDSIRYNQNLQELENKIEHSVFPTSSPIGPKIPPHLMHNKSDLYIGPNLRTNLKIDDDVIRQDQKIKNALNIGPQLPPHLLNNNKQQNSNSDCNPQVLSFQSKSKMMGPNLPPHLRKKLQEMKEPCSENDTEVEDEEDIYGPLPPGKSNDSSSHKALEERALQLKIDRLEPKNSNEPIRESWMIELPAPKAANFGLGPRQFRNRSGPDLSDRSSWTDLPGDKNKKKSEHPPWDLKAEAELKELRRRDKEQEMLTKKHKRKEKSLLKTHEEKLKNEKKGKGPSERKPFSRDIDLQLNRFDECQKKAIMTKAHFLDDRFSSGKSKYL